MHSLLSFCCLPDNLYSLTNRLRLAAQTRIGNLVNAKVDKCQPGSQNCDAQAGCQEPPPCTQYQRIGITRPIQHCTPTGAGNITQSQKLQPRLGENGVDDRTQELRGDDGDLVGEDLEEDDA